MLTQITIANFALIDHAVIDFSRGMTVVTGETGAGKSIIIDAIEFALGNRAKTYQIRLGAARAEVVLLFDISHSPTLLHWLREQALDGLHRQSLPGHAALRDG